MIEIFKIMKGFDDVQSSNFFILLEFNFENLPLKLYKPRCNLNICKYNFSNSVLDV